jgi:hypothetical protein
MDGVTLINADVHLPIAANLSPLADSIAAASSNLALTQAKGRDSSIAAATDRVFH